MRKTKKPPLSPDEQIVLEVQGGYKNSSRSGWSLGYHYLTNKRLIFTQGGRTVSEISLEKVTKVSLEEIFFVLKKKEAICLTLTDKEAAKLSKVWIIIANLETWRKKIYEMTASPIDEDIMNQIGEELDPVGQEILGYLWQNGHATLGELTELVEAPTHMEVLLKIREDINLVAERITGGPILVFERSKIDPLTGKKILFSWWLRGRERERKETLLDIFDEVDHLDVIMELLGFQEEDIRLKVEKDKLTVTAETLDQKYQEEISLPASVDPEEFTKKYYNNILAVKLEKLREREDLKNLKN